MADRLQSTFGAPARQRGIILLVSLILLLILTVMGLASMGGSLLEAAAALRAAGGTLVAAAAIVDRSGGAKPDFGVPFHSLIALEVKTWSPQDCALCAAGGTAVKPGSRHLGKTRA